MKLSRTVSYALQATLQLAQASPGKPVPCSRLAQVGEMPERFLLQILRNLVAQRILASARGVEGGYMLGRPPQQISLLELIEAVDGPLSTAVQISKTVPAESRERLTRALTTITALTRRELDCVKLSDLLPPSPARS